MIRSVITCIMLLGWIPLWAQRYVEVSAEIDLISYVRKDANGAPTRRTYSLTCITGTNEWRIETGFIPNAEECSYYDGTNVYRRIQVTGASTRTNSGLTKASSLKPFEKVNPTIWITPSRGGHPLGDLGVNIPWLAFCSGSFLKQAGRVVPLPTVEIRLSPEAFAYADKVNVFEDEFGLPSSLELLTSRELFAKSIADERLDRNVSNQRAKTAPASSVADGFLKFRYTVDESTNFLGWNFPTKFHYETYQADQLQSRIPLAAGSGRLIGIRESRSPKNVLLPEGIQTVVDYRFRHPTRLVDGIVYAATNLDAAPSTNNLELRGKFEALSKRAPMELQARTMKRRLPIVGLMILSSAVMFVIIWRTRIRKQS